MSWIRLDDQVYDHRKIRAIPRQTRWVWVAGLAFSSRNRLDGVVPRWALGSIEAGPRDIRALERTGLWIPADSGWQIHDYSDYQPMNGELSKKRSEAGKKGARSRWQLP